MYSALLVVGDCAEATKKEFTKSTEAERITPLFEILDLPAMEVTECWSPAIPRLYYVLEKSESP